MRDRTALFEHAQHLAAMIHGDSDRARAIVLRAFDRLPAAIRSQDKRVYYQSGGRATKVWLDEPQILQQLVFAASDRIERADESRRLPGASEMLVRYVKHLVWISTRRNAFHVAIAVARLLYGFTTSDTAQLHDSLVEHPEQAKDHDYYRARKRFLVREIRERFPSALRVDAGTILATQAEPGTRAVVEQSLTAFAPWGIACHDASRGDLHLMHVLLHPHCFRTHVMQLAWPDPLPRLSVPQFE